MRSFQRCLSYCTRIRCQFLHTFADAFQGWYKNGNSGTHNCRYFAGLYLLFRIVLLVAFITPMSYIQLILVPFPVVVSLLFAYFRPYKNMFFNMVDGLAFVLLYLALYLIIFVIRLVHLPIQILFVILLIPFLYFIHLVQNSLSRVAQFRTFCSRIRKKILAQNDHHLLIQRGNNRDDTIDEDLPEGL